jgi:hypothetical protein
MKQAMRCYIGVTTVLLLLGLMPVVSEAGSTKPNRLGNIDATLNQKMGQQNKAAKGQGAGDYRAKSTVLNAPAASTTQDSDLQMIQIQSSTSQRQNAVTETTQLLQNSQCKPCLNNIGQ